MRLKSWRKKRKLTRYALAQRAGLSRVHVKRLEEGQQSPTIDTVQRLAKALRVSLGRLLGIR